MKLTLLTTDLFIYALLLALVVYIRQVWRSPELSSNWRLVFQRPVGMASALVLGFFLSVGLLDSIHFRLALPATSGGASAQYGETQSVLDLILRPIESARERSYSAPLSIQGFRKESFERDGKPVRDFPRLQFGGKHLTDPSEHAADLTAKALRGLGWAALFVALSSALTLILAARRTGHPPAEVFRMALGGRSVWPWRTVFFTCAVLSVLVGLMASLSEGYHVLGTNQTGSSVLVMALKSIRTALVIGSLTTLVVLPLAVGLGVVGGYFRGWVDELIQYVYTLVASIPDVLLIAASVLLLQVFIDNNPALFETALERSDARLMFLCVILGLTSFTGLCRLVRGETLKLREMEYIQGAQAFGVSHARILWRHITPNLMHIVLIHAVMQFSTFILAEAVLSYVGVGVDPNTASFGIIINTARAELAASPVVWWTLLSAFVFMLMLVLSANLLADAIRDAFDPRARLRSSLFRITRRLGVGT
ncbi:MAG: Glutathione transport system permease protein GsiD [Pseudomonadota bacterium]|jgi:peptide/nickel transport system permease protein